MPYGGEKSDHEKLVDLNIKPYLFQKNNKLKVVYAGAMLPKAYAPLEAIFQAIKNNISDFNNVEFHFIGTGSLANDEKSFNIKPLAEKYGLWKTVVYEYPKRIPYLDVLVHLNISDGIFILGSTEPHYTPSKIYQAVLSEKFILAILHKDSSAVQIIRNSKAGVILDFNGESEVGFIYNNFKDSFTKFRNLQARFNPAGVDKKVFFNYSAFAVTSSLSELINKIIPN
jgi:hypothetical protein